MAFKAFAGSKVESEFVPWAEAYLEEHPKEIGYPRMVSDVKLTKKGMIIECKAWAGFVYKSEKLYNHVIEYCSGWQAAKKPAPQLQIMLQASKPFFVVGTDEERKGRWSKGELEAWHQCCDVVSDDPDNEANPLPLPSITPSSVLQTREEVLEGEDEVLTIKSVQKRSKKGAENGVTPY